MFGSLVEPIKNGATTTRAILEYDLLDSESKKMQFYLDKYDSIKGLAKELETAEKRAKKELSQKYLLELRELSKLNAYLQNRYRDRLLEAIESQSKADFEMLISLPLESISHQRIRAKIVEFYLSNYPKNSISQIEQMIKLEDLEQKSLQFIAEQELAYEEHLAVLKKQEAQMLKKTAKVGSKNSVLLIAGVDKNGNYEFEVENLNPFTITLSVDITNLLNLKTSVKLPFFTEISPKTKKNLFVLSKIVTNEPVDFKASYGWVRGSAYAVHDDSYIYQVPFAKGSSVRVSQGYHGGVSHKGLGAYAIDFPVPIGTPIHAARDGIVVATEGSNRLGGFSPEYRIHANYIVIEHSDKTMANYYHLNHNGVAVSIGDSVKRGDLIGYSGNTGYTSGPHLHFSVGKVDPVSMRRPMNMPIRIETADRVVTFPKKGDFYTVK